MSLADDHTSPAPPFYGDSTGEIFENPDLVLESPTTTERIVDTQSGFLVVVKHLGQRSAISVKRRLGTPPVSSILLTPDESLKLSRILSDGDIEEVSEKNSQVGHIPFDLNRWHSHITNNTLLLGLIAIVALTAGIMLAGYWRTYEHAQTIIGKANLETKLPTDEDIDKFVRTYVSNMLNFSPEHYRFSQIQAMSVMTPQLMAKYWRETNFPIAESQIKNNLKRETLVITKVAQQEPATNKLIRTVDVFAQLNDIDGKSSLPTHLQLKLTLSANHNEAIRVAEQNDLTASDK